MLFLELIKISQGKKIIACCQILLANVVCWQMYDPGQAGKLIQQKTDSGPLGKEKSLQIMLGVLLTPSYQ